MEMVHLTHYKNTAKGTESPDFLANVFLSHFPSNGQVSWTATEQTFNYKEKRPLVGIPGMGCVIASDWGLLGDRVN